MSKDIICIVVTWGLLLFLFIGLFIFNTYQSNKTNKLCDKVTQCLLEEQEELIKENEMLQYVTNNAESISKLTERVKFLELNKGEK